MSSHIKAIKSNYESADWKDVRELYAKYLRKREKPLMDSISSAMAVNSILISDQIDYSKITPDMEIAFHQTFPNMKIDDLEGMNSEQLTGVISNWKGKLFELNVRDKLNAGEYVGNIQLEEGQMAVVAESLNQPGWDLQILNEDGSVAQELQAKATDSLGYINEAFEKYPDIDIISTEEIAEVNSSLLNSNLTNEELTESIMQPMQSLFDTTLENFLESFFPALPVMIIAGSEGRNYILGKQSALQGFENILKRGTRSAASIGFGAILAWFDFGLLSLGGTFGLNYIWGRYDDNKEATKNLIEQDKKLRLLAANY